MVRPAAVLSIAGSDPSGGAGIQADLKTFTALGGYGMAVLTALTAQNTRGVSGVHPVPASFVREQLDALAEDVRIDAVKTGMLGSSDVVDVVWSFLKDIAPQQVPVVVDPVMVSTSGHRLIDDDAVEAMRRLLPAASVVTPNLNEASVLLDTHVASDEQQMLDQGKRLLDLGARAVLMKGGHLGGEPVDLWVDHDQHVRFSAERIVTANTHGTGCTLSSALAVLRPQRESWSTTVADAKQWLTEAIRSGEDLEIGEGSGPVDHFHAFRSVRSADR